MSRRQRGTGSVYQPEGSSIFWLQYYKSGAKQRESAETSDRKEALTRLKQRMAEIISGTFIGPNPKRVRIEELSGDFLRDYRINNKSSIDDAEARWRLHLQPIFGSIRASQLTTSLINEYIDLRQNEGAANATINRELAALKRMFNLGKAHTPPKVIFVPHFPKLKEDNVRKGFLEDEQYQRLIEACPQLWFVAIVEVGCTYGWRKGELLPLEVRQIDLEHRVIRLDPGTTKNEDGRTVLMTPLVHKYMSMCTEGKLPRERVFTWPNGRPVREFRHTWDKAVATAGTPDLLFHDLRRTAARNLRRAGIAEAVIMKIGGWRTRAMFIRYSIVEENDIAEAVEQFVNFKLQTAERIASNQSNKSWNLGVNTFSTSSGLSSDAGRAGRKLFLIK